MNCQDALRLLNRIQVGVAPQGEDAIAAADAGLVNDLLRRGLVMEVRNGHADEGKMAMLRQSLDRISQQRDVGGLSAQEAAAQAAPLRTQLLEMAEAQARGRAGLDLGERRLAVSYAGRSLLSALMTRQQRVADLDLDTFETQMKALRGALATRAQRASLILKELSPLLAPVDEIHLRTASVGLAVRSEDPANLARAFVNVFRALGQSNLSAIKHPLLAELAVVAGGLRDPAQATADVQRMMELRGKLANARPMASEADLVTAAGILFAHPTDNVDGLIDSVSRIADSFGAQVGVGAYLVTPWVLVASMGLDKQDKAMEWVRWFTAQLDSQAIPYDERAIASAILVASRGESGEELVAQFNRAHSYLTRLSPEGMVVPAAMLALMPSGIEETLDDLRMACAEVSNYRLSLAGMENLSLGVKLLVQAAVLASSTEGAPAGLQVGPSDMAALAPLGVAALAMVVPTAMAALYVFHEVTVHQQAVSNYAFHPVHTHFIYG